MQVFIRILWQVIKEPFRIFNDFMFENDSHHIVSKKGWAILSNKKDNRHETI
jgi:hypothetical protein